MIARWVSLVRRRAGTVALASLASSALLVAYAVPRLRIDTDTTAMFSEKLGWRRDLETYRDAFPDLRDPFIIVVEAADGFTAEAARAQLAERLAAEPELFVSVHQPGGGAFFERNALLYLDREQLEELEERVAEASPFLRVLAREPDLHGLLDGLAVATKASGHSPSLARLVDGAGRALTTGGATDVDPSTWIDLSPTPASRWAPARRVILATPRVDPEQAFPAGRALARIEELERELGLEPAAGVRVRVTGRLAIQNDELRSVGRAALIATCTSLLTVLVFLWIALRSVRLVAASLATIIAGLAGTAGFAAWSVGRLNLISIAFAILYIGLGIDYTIHFCLRWRELRADGASDGDALDATAGDIGAGLFLCAATTATGFFSFLASDLTATSELGLIAGTGMFVSLFATLTVLPSLITLLPPRPEAASARRRRPGLLALTGTALPRHRATVLLGAAALALGAAMLLPRVRFDASPLHLLDPDAESVAIYRDLLRTREPPPLTIAVLEDDSAAAQAAAARLERLDVVSQARTLNDYVPTDQAAKMDLIGRIARDLNPGNESGGSGRASVAEGSGPVSLEDIDTLAARVAAVAERPGSSAPTARAFAKRLKRFRGWLGRRTPEERANLFGRMERLVTSRLAPPLDRLESALAAAPFTITDLPSDVRSRWVARDGRHRVEVIPSQDLDDTDARRQFVRSVLAAEPHATGLPVFSIASGDVVVATFRRAFLISLAVIALILVLLLRDVRGAILVIVPLLFAGLLTGATAALFDMPFDYANVIALPLLLGVGVDNGILLVRRARVSPPADGNLLGTSTSRAAVFSGVTTMASFANLMLARHAGMASMGFVLTVGMGWTVLATIVLLPALLARRPARSRDGASAQPL